MELADFIYSRVDVLLADWREQAERLGGTPRRRNTSELEDSARELIEEIAGNMHESEGVQEPEERGNSKCPEESRALADVARRHAEQRLAIGFSLRDLIVEYHALRANVLRLWLATVREGGESLSGFVAFDEAVNQSLTESVACYSATLERTRDLFTGILVHDLRTPLGAISTSAQYLLQSDGLAPRPLQVAGSIHRSSERMRIIIQDLVDFTSTRLGGSLRVKTASTRLDKVCEQAIDEITSIHPAATVRLRRNGDLTGKWDAVRLGQLVTNLLENAIDHGRDGGTINVSAEGHPEAVTLAVENEGQPIPRELIPVIFDPLKRRAVDSRPRRVGAGLGLGLFIAHEIAAAHGGTIDVTSAEVTTFIVTLPRAAESVSPQTQ